MGRHDEKAIAFFGTWVVTGLFLDGWAHLHDKPETFFSPWHGVLYSGFTVAVAYFAFREYILRKPSTTDRLAAAGLVLFIVGAVGDFVWHEIFGIEVDIEALLSPTHLALLSGGLLMLSSGARRARGRADEGDPSFTRFFPTTMSLVLTTGIAVFFTQYFAAYRFGGLSNDGPEDIWVIHAIGSVFVTNMLLLGPALFAVRHWRTPLGTFAFLFGLIALGVQGMEEFRFALHIPGAAIAGLVTDLLAARLRPSAERRGAGLVFATVVPIVLWGTWFGTIQLMHGVHYAAELWTGTIILAALQGLGLGVLAFPGSVAKPSGPGSAGAYAGSVPRGSDQVVT